MENWGLGEVLLLLAATKSNKVVDILLKIKNNISDSKCIKSVTYRNITIKRLEARKYVSDVTTFLPQETGSTWSL
jgi:hypothetical protein